MHPIGKCALGMENVSTQMTGIQMQECIDTNLTEYILKVLVLQTGDCRLALSW